MRKMLLICLVAACSSNESATVSQLDGGGWGIDSMLGDAGAADRMTADSMLGDAGAADRGLSVDAIEVSSNVDAWDYDAGCPHEWCYQYGCQPWM